MFNILGQRQQDILQCLWDAKQINGDTPKYVKWENTRVGTLIVATLFTTDTK